MSLDRSNIGDVGERIKLFNSLMRGEFNDSKRVKELLAEMRQMDERQGRNSNTPEVENVKRNLQLFFSLHKANPERIDVPQLFYLPEEHNSTKLSLEVVLSRYSEKAKTVFTSEDGYNQDLNSLSANGSCSSCSFLRTLRQLLPKTESSSITDAEKTPPVSLSSGESFCDAVSQLSSSSTTSSASLASSASAASAASATTASVGSDDNFKNSFPLYLESLKTNEEQEFSLESLNYAGKTFKFVQSNENGKRKTDGLTEENPDIVADDIPIKKRRLNVGTESSVSSTKQHVSFSSGSLDVLDSQQLLSSFFEFQRFHLYSELAEKLWITEAWAMITNSRHAHIFSKPVRVKGYLQAVKRPTDLSCIKKKLEKKEIETVEQLHLELLRMFANAVMFNSSKSFCNQAAKEMALQLKQVIRSEKWHTFIDGQ